MRTALQQQVEQQWMALLMGVQESLMQAVPGIGILVGGVLAELAGARAALAVAGGGALAITAAGVGDPAAERADATARRLREAGTVMTPVRRACIDIGSNTTRLLIAECADGGLQALHQQKAFTRIGAALLARRGDRAFEDRRGGGGGRRTARSCPVVRRWECSRRRDRRDPASGERCSARGRDRS